VCDQWTSAEISWEFLFNVSSLATVATDNTYVDTVLHNRDLRIHFLITASMRTHDVYFKISGKGRDRLSVIIIIIIIIIRCIVFRQGSNNVFTGVLISP
jgi:hypothetical protein